MRLKSSLVVLSSFVLTALVSWATYSKKKQFYPTVVYLTNNQVCVAILLFQCAVVLFLVAKLLVRVFFGRLQQAEVENLISHSWYAFFDMCLVFAFFQDELGMEFLFLFSVLLLVRAFHWLTDVRVDYMERTPVITFLFHLRILTLIFLLAILDIFYIQKTYLKPSVHGLSVHLALGIEYFLLLLNLFSVTVRYIMHSIDSMREHPWDKKTMYLLYVDIVVGVVRLAIYAEFAVLMHAVHPLPLFIGRPVYQSVHKLYRSVKDVLKSRRAIWYMNTVFKNATAADLAPPGDTVCIICRDEMHVPSVGTQANQNMVIKKLPCTHLFHAGCLHSWFLRQQTCPTCRMDIIMQARQQEQQGQRQPARGQDSQNAGSTRATANNNTSSSGPSSGTESTGRPVWMPPSGMFPYYPGWPPYPTTTAATATTSSQPQGMSHPPFAFPSFPAPLVTPPFMGMPIIYPGNLFPKATLAMPEPPSGDPSSSTETQLRASVEARFVALRQISVLLNAAVLQMNAYLNAVTAPTSESDGSMVASSVQSTNLDPSVSCSKTMELVAEESPSTVSHTEVVDSAGRSESHLDQPEEDEFTSVRKRRIEHFANDTKSAND